MASIASLTAEEVRKMFSEKAIYHVEDSNVGQRVETMQRKGMLLETADGLDFCKQNVFDDMRVRHVLEALFPWSGIGIYEAYRQPSEAPSTIYGFMTGLEPLTAVVVQLWGPNSKMVYYDGSHQLQIEGFPLPIGLLEIPYAPLRQARCRPVPVEMKEGGIVVLDARLAFRIEGGYAIHCVFATREELRGWPKKKFPRNRGLEQKAAEMESQTMGLNFTFTD
ncbi:hypothetical protein H634G_10586 [Metarhizium anisopliae BRIP 53293]|uniref:Phytanoyl-CoA dioxygenase n=1 Tax=Metarhizium anisopliae BRIP 53293 TaxID=1291518 RepID=A0A0D9NKD7_METAN|nr:hypothetical protein H634G_10586 [Metarhizium anisopliae BRIP 53293]KJK85265.1 hypothetical protein H633G_10897 [Metarhizium anisopliae BRIP 53284]